MEKIKQRGMSKHAVLIGVLLTAVLIMVVLILAIPNLEGEKRFVSKEHGYSLVFDTTDTEYKKVILNTTDNVGMDRFTVKKSGGDCYLSVTDISAEADLEEALEAFESDGSFAFTREDNVTFGEEGYTARRISYKDETGSKPLEVTYYFDETDRILVSVCTDSESKAVLERILNSIRITGRQ